MRRRLPAVTIFSLCVIASSFAQTPNDPAPLAPPESPPPPPEAVGDEQAPRRHTFIEPGHAAKRLAESRGLVRLSPGDAGERIGLAEALYEVGDLDAAIEECRLAVRLDPNSARAHLQLGIMLMAKQDWRGAASVLAEAVLLDPALTDAHYGLGSVYYSLGDRKAAIQSYRQALALQPHFPDARYRLALLLMLSSQTQEAAKLMEEAALGGVSQAQYFLGNAYKNGQGVEKDLARTIFWWMKGVEYGYQPAADSLSKLRRQALSADQPEKKRREALEAFQRYRHKLSDEFHDYGSIEDGRTLGTKLLADGREDAAVPVLLKEGYALSEVAQTQLAKLYESGLGTVLKPYDKTILACFETTAAEGFVPAKRLLARVYGRGIGVPQDVRKAKGMLKGLPKNEIDAVLSELGGR
jgi:Flp pilus assembly protein TadD